jgi:uncharacterized protein (DUF2147 family)
LLTKRPHGRENTTPGRSHGFMARLSIYRYGEDMKKLLALIFVFVGAGLSFAEQMPDPAEGFWLQEGVDIIGVPQTGWELRASGGVLYGKILSAAGYAPADIAVKCKDSYRGFPVSGKANEMPLFGIPWIFGLRKESPGVWSGGFVINPLNGKIYKCRIAYHPADGKRYQTDTLEMRSETVLGIRNSQNWRRVTREQADALR